MQIYNKKDFAPIKKRFIEKLPELKNILGEIDDNKFSNFCRLLEVKLQIVYLTFQLVDTKMQSPRDLEKSPYLSNKKIDKKLKTAAKYLKKYIAIKIELYTSLRSECDHIFKKIITDKSKTELYNIGKSDGYSEYFCNIISTATGDFMLQNLVRDRISNNEFINPPKSRENYLELFQLIGETIQSTLNVRITSTYHKDEDSYGLFAKVIIWLFDVIEKPLPSSMENLLKDAVKILSDDWDKKEQPI